jgi:hypothetical protein
VATPASADRDSNTIIEAQLDERAAAVESAADADVLTYVGPMYRPADDEIKDAVEANAGARQAGTST